LPSSRSAPKPIWTRQSRRPKRPPKTGHDALPSERCRILNNVARVFHENADRLAVLEVLDSGKTLAEAQGDVQSSARLFEYYAGAADKLDGRSVNLGPDLTAFTVREPVGVTGHIIPWNYPTSTFARGVAPALAAGCSVVAKPAETTPFTALVMARAPERSRCAGRAGQCGDRPGQRCRRQTGPDPRIKQLTFTGSVTTGVNVAQTAAPNVTRLTLELGGKSPLVAFEDADPEKVADGAYWAIFSNSGQICSAGSRLILHKSFRDEVLAILTERASNLKSWPWPEEPDMGAINSDLHLAGSRRMSMRPRRAAPIS
jgi:aldehyde dehydrogenase (NAD+)